MKITDKSTKQKGFFLPIIIVCTLLIAGIVGVFIYEKYFDKSYLPPAPEEKSLQNLPTATADETSTWKLYNDSLLGFTFKFPATYILEKDNESAFDKRSNNKSGRDNFKQLMKHEAPEFSDAFRLYQVQSENPLQINEALMVWIFANPNNLSIDQWFESYWYYPLYWGAAIDSEVENNRPKTSTTINNYPAKYLVHDAQGGAIRFIYSQKNGKMFLFMVPDADKTSEKILSTFKFNSQ